jgi:hypothetical protein
MASPLADFSYMATDLSSTGIENIRHVSQLSELWGHVFGDYAMKKIAEMTDKDPTADVWNTPVDMTDAPRFHYTEETLGGRIKAILPPLAVLLGYCVVLFAVAYMTFIHYDVR